MNAVEIIRKEHTARQLSQDKLAMHQHSAKGHLLGVGLHHEQLPAPGGNHRVDISDVDAVKVHSADDLTQCLQQDALTLKVEGSHAFANDTQH